MYGSSSNHRTGSQQKSGTYRTDLYWNRYPFSEPYLQQKPESVQLCNNSLSSLNITGLTSLSSLDCRFNSLVSVDTTGCTALKDNLFFPQHTCTVNADHAGKISFDQLGNFHQQLDTPAAILAGDELLYTSGDDFFTLLSPAVTMTEASFSIMDTNTWQILGTCRMTINIESGTPVTPEKPSLKKSNPLMRLPSPGKSKECQWIPDSPQRKE